MTMRTFGFAVMWGYIPYCALLIAALLNPTWTPWLLIWLMIGLIPYSFVALSLVYGLFGIPVPYIRATYVIHPRW